MQLAKKVTTRSRDKFRAQYRDTVGVGVAARRPGVDPAGTGQRINRRLESDNVRTKEKSTKPPVLTRVSVV